MNRLRLLSLALLILLPATHSFAQISNDEVRIALLTDLSSIYSAVGQGSIIAAEMAIEDFGGTVRGKKIRLIVRDHKLDPKVAMKEAEDLDKNVHADAFLGMIGSNVAIPLQMYAKAHNILTMQTGSASSSLTGKYCSPIGVHWVYDTHALAAGTASAITKQGGKKWFFVTVDYIFGHLLEKEASGVVKANGGTVLGHALHPFKGRNFSAQLIEAQRSGAQVIAFADAGDDAKTALRDAYELGLMQGGQRIAGLLITRDVIRSLGLYVTSGLEYVTGWVSNRTPESKAWTERYQERAGENGSMFYAGIYSVVTQYLKAVEATGSDDPKTVIAKMRQMPVNDIFTHNGHLREDGLMVHDMYLVKVKSPSESHGWGDYYKVVKVIPGEDAFGGLADSTCPYIKNTNAAK